jgi:hypothetical protein
MDWRRGKKGPQVTREPGRESSPSRRVLWSAGSELNCIVLGRSEGGRGRLFLVTRGASKEAETHDYRHIGRGTGRGVI